MEGNRPAGWLFRDERDHQAFMDRLIDRIETYNIRLYAHCEMRTHFHALLETPQANLGRFMHSLNTAYTAFYNTRHRRHGHLFQGRYGAKPVEGDAYLLSLSRYIHLNPVHIKRIKALPLQEQRRHLRLYHWSSYRAYIGRGKTPDWLLPGPILALCGRTKKEQHAQYRALVESSLAEEDSEWVMAMKEPSLAIGDDAFIDDIRSRTIELMSRYKKREDVSLRHEWACLEPEEILSVTAEAVGVEAGDFRVRRRSSINRSIAARMLHKYAGLTQREIAAVLCFGSGSTVGKQQHRLTEELTRDRRLRRCVQELETRLAVLSGQ